MRNKVREIALIYCLTIVASIWLYRAIKGSTIYRTTTEIVLVLAVAIIIATVITILYQKRKKT